MNIKVGSSSFENRIIEKIEEVFEKVSNGLNVTLGRPFYLFHNDPYVRFRVYKGGWWNWLAGNSICLISANQEHVFFFFEDRNLMDDDIEGVKVAMKANSISS